MSRLWLPSWFFHIRFPMDNPPLIIPQLTPAAFSHLIGISAAAPSDWTDSDIFYLSAFVRPNIQQLWSVAELQFSGSRRDLAAEKGVGVCASMMERQGEGKTRECRGRKNLTLSLKMNEKMGYPRVAAWKEAESIQPFGSAAPSQVLEMNKRKKLVHFVAAVVRLNGAQIWVSVFFPQPHSACVCATVASCVQSVWG